MFVENIYKKFFDVHVTLFLSALSEVVSASCCDFCFGSERRQISF